MTTEEKKDDCACGGLDAVYASIDALVDFARKRLELDPRDADWTRNRIFELFSLDSYRPTGATSDDTLPDDLLTRFRAAAVAAGLFDADEGPVYADIVMGMLSGTPSAVQDRFEAVEREHGGMEAMRWFYDYCVANNYVKKGVLDKNPRFDSHGLVITINLAKPEFKNMKKAAAGNSVAGGYPACTICHENEGFAGRNKRTLRTIPATLGDEPWFWQFSPYGYFYQHGICVNDEHTPMHVSRSTFGHLLDFVDRFPGYFLGCNAALPRIGEGWINYSNPELDIICEGEDGKRSAVSPSAIITERGYEMSLIFRNNSVSEELPEGIFHAHPEFWPVKQEPIGLIEAQGLFILPGRLINQLGLIEDALAEGNPLPEEVGEFTLEWDELTATLNGERDRDAIHAAVQDELGSVCERILGNTAVFKHKELTRDFMEGLGFHTQH